MELSNLANTYCLLDLLKFYLLLGLFKFLLLLYLLLDGFLLISFSHRFSFLDVELAIIIIAGMLFLEGFSRKIIVVNSLSWTLAWLPRCWKWRLKSLFGNIEVGLILLDLHTQESSVLFDFFSRGVVIVVQLFLHELESVKAYCTS